MKARRARRAAIDEPMDRPASPVTVERGGCVLLMMEAAWAEAVTTTVLVDVELIWTIGEGVVVVAADGEEIGLVLMATASFCEHQFRKKAARKRTYVAVKLRRRERRALGGRRHKGLR